MKLGAFSISLSVKDLTTSKAFYEKMGFIVHAGEMEKNYLIMRNNNALVGLFQGMFEGNIMTFNPGWDEQGKEIEDFDDVRDIQKKLQDADFPFMVNAPEDGTGPASFMVKDPDGNVILVDQHR